MTDKKRALLSVSDKTGIVELARGLTEMGWEILSTGGTARALSDAGVEVTPVDDVTKFPEIMDGRIKTLHPNIHAAILANRDIDKHMKQLAEFEIEPIDILAVNLYPFRRTIANPEVKLDEAVEQIDIGGPTMLRSAAKNFKHVLVVVKPEQYGELLERLKDARDDFDYRLSLSQEVFAHTASYDFAISRYLETRAGRDEVIDFGNYFFMAGARGYDLRYGENPHQNAAFYTAHGIEPSGIAAAEYLSGKSLSFNNLLDADGAYRFILDFDDKPTAVVMKHQNPCGAAWDEDSIVNAYIKARAVDPLSAFGGIVGVNRNVNMALAKELMTSFLEVVVAPGYDDDALETLKKKRKNVRLLKVDMNIDLETQLELKKITSGILVQKFDTHVDDVRNCEVVTKRAPTEDEWKALEFGWKCVKFVKSNAIVYSFADRLAGVGAGQMSRVDSVKIAAMKANEDLTGSCMASDAFFPFADGVEEAAKNGVKAVIQPGGSKRDPEVIEAADKLGLAMVLTGHRHFRH